MAKAETPYAPQRALTPHERRSGVGYGPGVSYTADGLLNPAGKRTGTVTTCTTQAELATAFANATYGDDIVIPSGTANRILSATQTQVRVMPAVTASTPRQWPEPIQTYDRDVGLVLATPASQATPAAQATAASQATPEPQGAPSYIRVMGSNAAAIATPPPHTTWHVTHYESFGHLRNTNQFAPLLGTPDTLSGELYRRYHHWRFEGLCFDMSIPNGIGFWINWGSANAYGGTTKRATHHIIFDRCYLDCDSCGTGVISARSRAGGYGVPKGMQVSCDFFGLMNSRDSGVWADKAGWTSEANSYYAGGGIGPHYIANNYLSACGEGVFYHDGRALGYPPPYVVSDVTFTRNWVIRPLSWRQSFRSTRTETAPSNNTVTIAANGIDCTLLVDNMLTGNFCAWQVGDYLYAVDVGRPVRIAALTGSNTFQLGAPYTEKAGQANVTVAIPMGPAGVGGPILAGLEGGTATLSGSGNRTVTGTNTNWLTSVKPFVDNPPPGSGVFFGVNINVNTATRSWMNGALQAPILRQILSVQSDTQMTLAEDYTVGTWTNVYYTVTCWDGQGRSVMKNLHEMKATNRLRVLGNVYENTWATFNGQGANALSQNTSSKCYSRDALYRHNLIVNAGLVHYVTGFDFVFNGPDEDRTLGPTRRICFEHNLAVDVYNARWQHDHRLQFGTVYGNVGTQFVLDQSAFNGSNGYGSGVHDYINRHNAIIFSTHYNDSVTVMTARIGGTLPLIQHQRFTCVDNLTHVGHHVTPVRPGGFFAFGTSSPLSDALDIDGMMANGDGLGNPRASSDSVVARNVLMRGSAPVIPQNSVNWGGENAGLADETGVGFAAYGNAAHIPAWLTQSVDPTDYALGPVYTTVAGACTVSGATVTIASGVFPSTIAAGTPFRVQGDAASVMGVVLTRDNSQQVTLKAAYLGTTGAGLTGVFSFQGMASDSETQTIYTTDAGAVTVTNITARSYTETWTHADAAGLTADQTWVETTGTNWEIVGNAAKLNTAAAPRQIAVCQTDLLGSDHLAQVTLATYNNVSNAQGGPCVRTTAGGASMYHFTPALGRFELNRIVNGAASTIATNATVPAAGQVLKLEATGSTIIASINGTPVITVTDTVINAGTFAGIAGLRANAGDTVVLDNFSAQTTNPLDISQVTLSAGSFPGTVAPTNLFQRTFLVNGDQPGQAVRVSRRDSATQLTLAGAYPGTTGAGLTATISGDVPIGADPGPDVTALAAAISGIRT